jgi:hypothetical protein
MMQLIVWEQFHGSYREYIIYSFDDDGTPSETCRVRYRGQGCPHSHLITLIKDGETLLSQQRGRNMKDGTYILPKQFYHVKGSGGFVELSCEKVKTSERLPNKQWFQYKDFRIQWEKNSHFIPAMDISPTKTSCYVYQPTQIVL